MSADRKGDREAMDEDGGPAAGEGLRVLLPAMAGRPPDPLESLDAPLAHYLLRVLRAEEGATLEVVPGDGRLLRGRLQVEGKRAAAAGLEEVERAASETAPTVELWAALIRPSRWDWLVEKAAELGAARLRPLITERTQARLPARREGRKVERWQDIADSAVRQCGRLHRMEVLPPLSLEEALAQTAAAPEPPTLAFADESRAGRWAVDPGLQAAAQVALVIGPEGGFDPAEAERLRAAGALGVRLGPTVLRSETAAVAGLALLLSARGAKGQDGRAGDCEAPSV